MRTLGWRQVRSLAFGAAALAALLLAQGDRRSALAADLRPIDALAPVEVLASGFAQPSGVAVEPSGAVLVTDRAAGTLTRVHADGRHERLLDGLRGPSGVAVDAAGQIFLVEAAGRRIVRIGVDGSSTVLAATLRQPRAVAVAPDGQVFVAMRGATEADFLVARLEESGALTEIAAGFINLEGLAAAGSAIYVAMARLMEERGSARTAVVRIAIREDGTAGAVEPLLSGGVHRALAAGVDVLGEVFVGGATSDAREGRSGVILKRHHDGRITGFAAGLVEPAGLAFAPGGDLIAIERRHPGRVLRFRPPPPPEVDVPPFTNRSPLPIRGRARAGDRVQLFPSGAMHPLATATADDLGAFVLSAPLAPNDSTDLVFRATAAGGLGLTGGGVAAIVLHDDVLPRVVMLEPPAGVHTRGPVVLRARAEDEGSGVAVATFLLDDAVVAAVMNESPPAPLVAAAMVPADTAAEGLHAVTVSAADRAGNQAAAAQLLVIDRTPPDTQIVRGPGAETADPDVRFEIGGTDVWSPALQFSWRLDEGAWSPYSPSQVVALNGVTPGRHRFEARARDLAGNEDPTPAVQAFTVQSLRVRIAAPAPDSLVTAETVWVRGIVQGAEPVAVTVQLPPELRSALAVESLPVPAIAGTFAVEVPVTPATTALTVVAAAQGATASDTVPISVQPLLASPVGGFQVWPPAGFAPHLVMFDARSLPAGSYVLDIESDGVVDYTGETLEGREFLYAGPGVHLATLRIMTPAGQTHEARTAVQVYDRTAVDARLRAAWGGFKDALRAGDVDRAVTFVHGARRARWAEYFRQFTADMFLGVDEVFTDVMVVDVAPGRVECEMLRDVGGVLYSFPVSFVLDADGSWRLWQF
ncbi:MAG: hypothetical protein HYY76_01700 [Acidobacteria bacterium]|nr:hypothetical protein [Acidobacteriota bacterium]